MSEIIDFQRKKNKQVKENIDKELSRINYLKCLRVMRDNTYAVDLDLLMEGWLPLKSIAIDDEFFTKRDAYRKNLDNPDIKEVRTAYKDGTPCVAFYFDDKTFLRKLF